MFAVFKVLKMRSWIDSCLQEALVLVIILGELVHLPSFTSPANISLTSHTSLSYDDLGSVLNLSDSRTQMMVSGFEKALEAWRKSVEFIKDSMSRLHSS